jgi:hypothetical protein
MMERLILSFGNTSVHCPFHILLLHFLHFHISNYHLRDQVLIYLDEHFRIVASHSLGLRYYRSQDDHHHTKITISSLWELYGHNIWKFQHMVAQCRYYGIGISFCPSKLNLRFLGCSNADRNRCQTCEQAQAIKERDTQDAAFDKSSSKGDSGLEWMTGHFSEPENAEMLQTWNEIKSSVEEYQRSEFTAPKKKAPINPSKDLLDFIFS